MILKYSKIVPVKYEKKLGKNEMIPKVKKVSKTFRKKLNFYDLNNWEINDLISNKLMRYSKYRYNILSECYIFPNDINNMIHNYLPNEEILCLEPGFENQLLILN